MNHRLPSIASTTVLALLSGLAFGADATNNQCEDAAHSTSNHATSDYPDSIAHPDTIFVRQLAEKMLPALPAAHQQIIQDSEALGTTDFGFLGLNFGSPDIVVPEIPEGITANEYLDMLLGDGVANELTADQLKIVRTTADVLDAGNIIPSMCFAPGTSTKFAFTMDQLLNYQATNDDGGLRFIGTARWTNTATNGGGLSQGAPTTITYSYPPDGSFIPNSGLGSGSQQLFQWLDGLYGNTATWQSLYAQVFDRWSELIGVTFVFEPNDDGSSMSSASGSLGVRGDIRLFAFNYPFDGNGGVLAYNFFPNDGDMAIDAFDSFYNSTGAGSRRFRNVVSHELGHGLGMSHVCPANATKLMEPFISTAYDGPQLDDTIGGQRRYGDIFELNDTPFNPTDLGSFAGPGFASIDDLSIDDNGDTDYFRVTVTSPVELTMTISPAAATYPNGPQTGACNTMSTINYNTIHDLEIEVFSSANVFVPLQSEDSEGAGGTEVLVFEAITPGDYLFRVAPTTNTNNIQLYDLALTVDDVPFLSPTITAAAPASVQPDETTDFAVTINANDDTINGGSQLLNVSINGGSFTTSPLASLGGSSYLATLPAANCEDTINFFISAVGSTAGSFTLPANGAAAPFLAVVGDLTVVINDNFEANLGWSVSGAPNGASEGEWERAFPTGDGSRGDPITDFDGSGQCYITGNGGPGENNDVDGGQTILTSPTIDVSSSPDALVSYARWLDNTGAGVGPAQGEDPMTVQISDDNGGSWTDLEIVGPNSAESMGGWFQASFKISDFVATTNQVRVRFIAQDQINGSIVEAGVDAFNVSNLTCDDTVECQADLAAPFGTLNLQDVFAYLALFNAADPAADLAAPFGSLNLQDVFAYLALFNAGCP
ncbi:MAG: matrixin family metalloprotease [Phycisphaerales bacterium]|nr:matrixin family metalloprotease [Phycisphaerales bacterium]